MPIVNFEVKTPLEQKIKKAIKEYGFTSKAEFFRFTAVNFIHQREISKIEDARLQYLSSELEKTVSEKFKKENIPSIEKQLADV